MNNNNSFEAERAKEVKSRVLSELVDISLIRVEASLPTEARFEKYIADVGDPYSFRVGSTEVRLSFTDGGAALQSMLESLFCGGV